MGKFRKGDARPANAGRRPGSQNKTTSLLKDAVLLAAQLEGDVTMQTGKTPAQLNRETLKESGSRGGVVGYLRTNKSNAAWHR